MDLAQFLAQTQEDVRSEIGNRLEPSGGAYPYPESVFAEVVMDHMFEVGMTFDPVVCHYSSKVGNSILKLSGYAISEDADQIDLFVSLYSGVNEITEIPDVETKKAVDHCLRFLKHCVEGKLASQMEQSQDAYGFALMIQHCYEKLDQIRIYVLTDRVAKAKNFKAREVGGRIIKLEVMDIERLHRHMSAGKSRDELVVNFNEICGSALPCVFVPGEGTDYDCVLTVMPGDALRFIYEKYGARILEANVRSFLSATAKVNKGIQKTLREAPERFLAFNNGVVLVADEALLGTTADGGPGLLWLKGMQVVNGGQTTASIYFTKRKNSDIDLRRVRVPAKVVVLKSLDAAAEEALISEISRCANSQTQVKQSDLSANRPFHIVLERLSQTTVCPDGVGRWFYERAAGSYNTMLAREGTTPAKLRKLKVEVYPPARKITKTELAKYLNAWDQRPDAVSFGSQKNFERFMESFRGHEGQPETEPDAPYFKALVAKALLFKKAQTLVRPMFPAFQANVATYLVSLVANRLGTKLDLGRIWAKQDISPGLCVLLQRWANEVHAVLHASANGRMVSEWAKKAECWEVVRAARYSEAGDGIPELR